MAVSDTSSSVGRFGEQLVRALSDATDDQSAISAVLKEVANATGSDLATLWLLDEETGLLRFDNDWALGDATSELRVIAARLTFAPGVGLPGRVLEAVSASSVLDIAADSSFSRADAALRAGLRSAIAGPVLAPDGALGVIEVFSSVTFADDHPSRSTVTLAGRQLGAYLGRRRIEDRLRASEEASASIVQAALDCIITMDHRGRVIDLNPAAERTLGYERDAAIGEILADLIIPAEHREAHQRALASFLETRQATILDRRLEVNGMRANETTFPAELTVTRLGSREPPIFAGFLRDITERRTSEERHAALLEREQAERARAEQAERAARDVAEVLQQSLLPPALPEIAGLEVGAAYRAGTVGWDVGGDFFDVFKLARGRWAFAIGDVCGKGPRAAALTARVRYALRDAAVQESTPSRVLRAVNDLLMRDPDGEFLTAVFATVDITEKRARVTLAIGGHPLPLLVRSSGEVVQVGRPGTLVGAFAGAQADDAELDLTGSDVLVLYTDGVTEASTGDGRFGEERLRQVLGAGAGKPPQALCDEVDLAVVSARRPGAGDDVALLALTARSV